MNSPRNGASHVSFRRAAIKAALIGPRPVHVGRPFAHTDGATLMEGLAVLRHLVATLAYRAAKVVRDVPPDFPTASLSPTTRRPVLIAAHMADLLAWALSLAEGRSDWKPAGTDNWDVEIRRFFSGLEALDRRIAGSPLSSDSIEKLVQGPLADALTHVGQLAMLRGMAGAPIRPESYARARIVAGRVGFEQAPPGREFDGDASLPR